MCSRTRLGGSREPLEKLMSYKVPHFRVRFFGFPLALTCIILLVAAAAQAVGTRYFVVESQKDFSSGELEGVSVDSLGHLRAGLDWGNQSVPEVDSAWDALEHDGGLLVATGNQGKLLRASRGQVEEIASAQALALTSLTKAWGDRVIVGAMPGGKLYELVGDKLIEFASLETAESDATESSDSTLHVWDVAFDEKKQALFAATGPKGQLFRITDDGTVQLYFDSDQPHLVSVASGGGTIYCGSSGKARLYRLSSPGRARVLYDFESTEVRAIEVGKDGSVYAVANELNDDPRSTLGKPKRAAGPRHASPKKGEGVLFHFSPDGVPEELFASDREHIVSLALDQKGRPLIGTGVKGHLFRIDENHHSVLLADLEERQVSDIMVRGGAGPDGLRGWLVASDPVVVHEIRGQGGHDSVWTSEVFDAGLRARFGRVNWNAKGAVRLSTRSGNTSDPDATWSDWSNEMTSDGPVQSPVGRYFQVRVRMPRGDEAVLRRIEVPFVTDNLRPVVTEITAESGAQNQATEEGAQKSGHPMESEAKPEISVRWEVHNPDEDELRYFVEYRPVGSPDWLSALEPQEVLTHSKFTWKTHDLPEGRYVLRVTASDELSNPPERVKKHQMESSVVLVDNSAPRIGGIEVRGSVVGGTAVDGVGPVRRIEARVAGRPEWIPFEPADGIFDQSREAFVLDLSSQLPSHPTMVTLRVFDTAGNFDVRHVRLSGRTR